MRPERWLTVAQNPLSFERDSLLVPADLSLSEMLEKIPGGQDQLRVCIDGVPIPEDQWAWLYPDRDVVITARRVATEGVGGRGKNIAALVAGVVLIAASFYVPATGVFGAKLITASSVALLGASLALSGVLGLVTARPRVKDPGAVGGPDRFSIQGTQNIFEPYGAIPTVFGTTKVFPKMGAVPFTEVANGEQLVRQVFIWSYGEVASISNVKIGETPFGNFTGAQIETQLGTPTDPPLSLYSRDVNEVGLSILIDQVGSWRQQTTIAGVSTISIDATAQSGFGKFQKDGDFKGILRLCWKLNMR